jgi:hypothetical protein
MLVKKESFHLVSGSEYISTFLPGNDYKYHRNFCKVCGTGLGEVLSAEDSFPVALNCIDEGPQVEIKFNEFEGEIPSWYKVSK